MNKINSPCILHMIHAFSLCGNVLFTCGDTLSRRVGYSFYYSSFNLLQGNGATYGKLCYCCEKHIFMKLQWFWSAQHIEKWTSYIKYRRLPSFEIQIKKERIINIWWILTLTKHRNTNKHSPLTLFKIKSFTKKRSIKCVLFLLCVFLVSISFHALLCTGLTKGQETNRYLSTW